MTTKRLPKRSAREVPTAANRYIILEASEATQAVKEENRLLCKSGPGQNLSYRKSVVLMFNFVNNTFISLNPRFIVKGSASGVEVGMGGLPYINGGDARRKF